MNRNLSRLCRKPKTFYTYNIPYIEEFLKNDVIKRFIFIRTNIVAANVNLNSSSFILKLNKRSVTHNPAAHDSSGNGYLTIIALVAFVIFENLFRRCVNIKKLCRIWVYPEPLEFLK